MTMSVSQRINAASLDRMTEAQLRALLGNMVDAMQAICAKLDADATVTDVNYLATLNQFIVD